MSRYTWSFSNGEILVKNYELKFMGTGNPNTAPTNELNIFYFDQQTEFLILLQQSWNSKCPTKYLVDKSFCKGLWYSHLHIIRTLKLALAFGRILDRADIFAFCWHITTFVEQALSWDLIVIEYNKSGKIRIHIKQMDW